MEINDIINAKKLLNSILIPTHLISVPDIKDYSLFIKPENLQRTGSFKIRGAFNKISKLSNQEISKGIIACSAGNHAQGVAFAAKYFQAHSVVCMPKSTPKIKIESTKDLGAEVVLVDGVYDDSYQKAIELQKENGYIFVHPFNDLDVIAGQGTIGLEILEDNPDIEAVIVPVGGGGLIAGISYAIKSINPKVKVYGVQAKGAASMYLSLASGYVRKIETINTIADGIAVKEVGNLTLDFVEKYVDDIITVNDNEIIETIKLLFEYKKLVVEGAGAASAAGLFAGRLPINNKKVAVVVSGGNIDLSKFINIIEKHK